jgi:hypothetical protein
LTSIASKNSKRRALHRSDFKKINKNKIQGLKFLTAPHHDKIPFLLEIASPSFQNNPKSCLFSENNPEYLSIFDPRLTGRQWSSGCRSRPWKAKAGSLSKLTQLLGSILGRDMELFYQITLNYLIFGAELNRSVLRGFPERETGNRSQIRGYFTPGRAWFFDRIRVVVR